MTRRADRSFQSDLRSLFGVWSVLVALVAFLIVIPLMLWYGWKESRHPGRSFATTVFALVFAWATVSMLQMQRGIRRLGSGAAAYGVLSGARPSDPDEYFLWKRAWQFMISIILLLLTKFLIPFL